uniref:Uncharacterized protein n=1 Tax=Onchocerca volvulus TaxID=6282 RepID=A0A8R1Y1F1_ONCVO
MALFRAKSKKYQLEYVKYSSEMEIDKKSLLSYDYIDLIAILLTKQVGYSIPAFDISNKMFYSNTIFTDTI